MPPINLPSLERFVCPSPGRTSSLHLEELRQRGNINNNIALQIQMDIHRLRAESGYFECLRRWPRVVLREIQRMAFEGFYPAPRDFERLEESLREKDGPIHEQVRDFRTRTEELISREEDYWMRSRWIDDPHALREQQDTEAGREMTRRLAGRVAFFGSARLNDKSPEYDATRWLARMTTEHLGQKTVSGGGPGIMEASNKGTLEGAWNCMNRLRRTAERPGADASAIVEHIELYRREMHSVGVRIELPFETGWNNHLQANLSISEFPGRKRTLIHLVTGRQEFPPLSKGVYPGFFIKPGGYGTADETWEVAAAQQCGKMPKAPILTIGADQCRLIDVAVESMIEAGTISSRDGDYFVFCKDEVDGLKKYMEWHKIDPPSGVMDEVRRRRPTMGTASVEDAKDTLPKAASA